MCWKSVQFRIEYPADCGTLVSMIIESQELPPIGTNAFALIDTDLKACVIIDAPTEAFEWATRTAKKHDCAIVALILTHGHWDHMLDGYKFANAGVPVYGHKADALMFANPSVMASYAMPELEFQAVPIDHWIAGGDVLKLLTTEMEIRHVPGHCPGNVLIYLGRESAAFPGDAIFRGSVGRYDLPGGDVAVLSQSIKSQIYTLPDATTLYPGHGPTTTVAAEKSGNPFVRG